MKHKANSCEVTVDDDLDINILGADRTSKEEWTGRGRDAEDVW